MKDEIVIYRSLSGFSEKYARWIAEDFECECVPYGEISKEELLKYRCVVFGGYVRFEKMDAAKEIAEFISGLPDVVLYIVGATPMTDRIATGYMLRRTYRQSKYFQFVPHFYLQGGMAIDRLGRMERFLVRIMIFIIKYLPFATKDMKDAGERMGHSADFSNRANISALVEYVKAGR